MRSRAAALLAFGWLVLPATAPASASAGSAADGAPMAAAVADSSAAARRLSLAEAVREAVGETPAVRIAAFQSRAAKDKRAQARAALLPTLSGSALLSNRTFNLRATGIDFPSSPGVPSLPDRQGPVNLADARLQVTQTLFDYASWTKLDAAAQGVEVSRADADAASEAAAERAALAYLAAARAQALVTARESDVALARDLLDVAEGQLQAGVGANIDVTRARTQLAVSQAQRLVARNQLDRAQIGLARALGLDPSRRFELADTLSDAIASLSAPLDSAAILSTALARRPELRAERLRLERARTDRSAIAAERLPRLQASADYGLSGQDFPKAFPTYDLSLALSVPILDGLRRESRIAEQRSVIRQSQVRERDLQDQVTGEVQGAFLDLASARQQERVAEEQIRLAEEEVAEARERFVSGVAGNIEVINAQASLIRARDAQINARHASAVARVVLARAAGAAGTIR